MITIKKPYVEESGDTTFFKASIVDSVQHIDDVLWYQVPREYGGYFVADVADPFLVSVLLPAIRYCEDIVVEAYVSEQLYYNICNYIIPCLTAMWGGYVPNISVEGVVATNYMPTASATGCSMGVDSLSAIFHHTSKECLEGYKLTHLTYFNVGAHGTTNIEATEESFFNDLQLINEFATEINLPVVWVNTNMHLLYYEFSFDQTHTLRNISVVLSLQKLFRRYYYASSFTIDKIRLSKEYMSYFEELLLARLSTESTSLMLEDAAWGRSDKTNYIALNPLSYKYLYVCLKEQIANDGGDEDIARIKDEKLNCSRCKKCLRTMLTLDVIGKLPEFSDVFDIEYFNRIKKYYIGKIIYLKKDDAISLDIYKLMIKEGYRIPVFSKFFAFFYQFYVIICPDKFHKWVLKKFRNK